MILFKTDELFLCGVEKMIEKRSLESDTVQKQQSPTKQCYELCYEMHKIYIKKSSKAPKVLL